MVVDVQVYSNLLMCPPASQPARKGGREGLAPGWRRVNPIILVPSYSGSPERPAGNGNLHPLPRHKFHRSIEFRRVGRRPRASSPENLSN